MDEIQPQERIQKHKKAGYITHIKCARKKYNKVKFWQPEFGAMYNPQITADIEKVVTKL